MPPADPPSSITLKVKVPPGYLSPNDSAGGPNDEFLLGETYASSSISQVRQRITTIVPTNPAPERQRLLYCGRALTDNEQSVADALNTRRDPTQLEYVLHLLVRNEDGSTAPRASGDIHRRTASTPSTPGTRDGSDGQQRQSPHVQQHIRLQQQMMEQTERNAANGIMPPVAGQSGARAMLNPLGPRVPQGAQVGAHAPETGWQQVLAQEQQRRAAAGSHGIETRDGLRAGHEARIEDVQQQPQQTQQAHQPASGEMPDQSVNAEQTEPSSQQSNPSSQQQNPQVPGRTISGQGFHMQGVGPNGQRFQIHHQTMNFPNRGRGNPFGPMPHIAGAHGPHNHHGGSALDRARENMADMQRVLTELRESRSDPEDVQRRLTELQERTQRLNDYIDPFPGMRGPNPTGPPRNPPNMPPTTVTQIEADARAAAQRARQSMRPPTRAGPNSNEVTAHLLSGPDGPKAILFSPQHGRYTGTLANNAQPPRPTRAIPTPTSTTSQRPRTAQPDNLNAPNAPPAPPHAGAAPAAPAQPPAPALNPVNAVLAHFWLLLRLGIFAYFVLGMDMSWERPFLLTLAGLGFWLVRAGAFGDVAGGVRAWWEGVVGVPGADDEARRARLRDGAAGERQAAGAAGAENGAGDAARGRPMPTPEQVAARLLDEEERRRRAQQPWWREQLRPVERAAALFVASLWPGVGEAHVEAREREARRVAEEEVEARRREEDVGAARGQEEKREKEGENGEGCVVEGVGEGSGEKASAGETSGEKSAHASASSMEKTPVASEGGEPTGEKSAAVASGS